MDHGHSFLQAADVPPSPGLNSRDAHFVGIAEWSYDVPVAFKLLLTGDPGKTRSLIWMPPMK
jgi:hypothetical protein